MAPGKISLELRPAHHFSCFPCRPPRHLCLCPCLGSGFGRSIRQCPNHPSCVRAPAAYPENPLASATRTSIELSYGRHSQTVEGFGKQLTSALDQAGLNLDASLQSGNAAQFHIMQSKADALESLCAFTLNCELKCRSISW